MFFCLLPLERIDVGCLKGRKRGLKGRAKVWDRAEEMAFSMSRGEKRMKQQEIKPRLSDFPTNLSELAKVVFVLFPPWKNKCKFRTDDIITSRSNLDLVSISFLLDIFSGVTYSFRRLVLYSH